MPTLIAHSAKSTLGYIFFYDSAPISWYSKLHSFVTTSTNHSEYAALALGAKEAQWLALLFQEIDPKPTKAHTPVPIYGDSSGVIALVFNPVEHQANKHIRVADHYARELTKEGVIAPHRIPSELNKADPFTKPLQSTSFKRAAGWLVGNRIQLEAVYMFTTAENGDACEYEQMPCISCLHCNAISIPGRVEVQCVHCSGCEFKWECSCYQSKAHQGRAKVGVLVQESKSRSFTVPCQKPLSFPLMSPSFSANGCESSRDFDYAYYEPPVPALVDANPPPIVRPRRRKYDQIEQSARCSARDKKPPVPTWSAMVAFLGAKNRRTVFHLATCQFITAHPSRKWKYSTKSQANGYGMRPANGCQYACLQRES
jgi:hypothetical protein